MDLWIRSQDKESIVKINSSVSLKYNDKKTIIANYIPDFSDNYDGSYDILGTYESKERALEVLDEIQEHIGFLNVEMGAERFGELDFQADIVYEMPKE